MQHVRCKVAGCPARVRAQGFCERHYARYWRTGKVPAPSAIVAPQRVDSEQLPLAEAVRRLREAKCSYASVTGIEGRLLWRERVRELEHRVRLAIAEAEEADRQADLRRLQR